MTTELTVLAWGALLGLVHIFAAGHVKTRQYGAKWNMGARDEALPDPEPIVGRMMRAQANYFETFPIVVAAIAIVAIAGLESRWTAIGAVLWLACSGDLSAALCGGRARAEKHRVPGKRGGDCHAAVGCAVLTAVDAPRITPAKAGVVCGVRCRWMHLLPRGMPASAGVKRHWRGFPTRYRGGMMVAPAIVDERMQKGRPGYRTAPYGN